MKNKIKHNFKRFLIFFTFEIETKLFKKWLAKKNFKFS